MSPSSDVRILPDREASFQAAADEFARRWWTASADSRPLSVGRPPSILKGLLSSVVGRPLKVVGRPLKVVGRPLKVVDRPSSWIVIKAVSRRDDRS